MPRKYGQGTIYKRGARYWIQYSVGGRVIRESCGPDCRDAKQAREILRERLHAHDRGLRASDATISDLLDLYLEHQQRRDSRDKSAQSRVEILRERIGALRASRFGPREVDRLQRHLVDVRKVGPATVNRYGAVLKCAFNLARKRGLALQPPYWPQHAEPEARHDYLDPETFGAIAAELRQPYRALATAAYWTGCRRGELLGWRWEYLSADRTSALIPRTKSRKPRRVALPEIVRRELLALELRRERDWPASPWIFTADGRPLSQWTLRDQWEKAREAAGRPEARFHATRHSALTHLREAGVEEAVAMQQSGHETSSVFRRYGIIPRKLLDEAAAKMDRLAEEKGREAEEADRGDEGSIQ